MGWNAARALLTGTRRGRLAEAELVNFTQRVEKFDQVLRIMTRLKQPATLVKARIYLVSGEETSAVETNVDVF